MIDVSKLTDADIDRWVAYVRSNHGNFETTNYIGQYKGFDAMAGMIRVYWPKLKQATYHLPTSLVFIETPDKELFDK